MVNGSSERRIRILVSDIDGTLLRDGEPTSGLGTLRRMLAAGGDDVWLAYATGRTFDSVRELVEQGALPGPQAVAALVGTELWLPPWEAADEEYSREISQGWDREAVEEIVAGHSGEIEPQPEVYQSPWKASYFLERESLVPRLEREIAKRGVEAQLIHSSGNLLDVIPARAGKRPAAEHLCRRWEASSGDVLAAGDSGNDLDMLGHPRFMGVAVGNAKEELDREVDEMPRVHDASRDFAAGVLEGAAVFRFWPAHARAEGDARSKSAVDES